VFKSAANVRLIAVLTAVFSCLPGIAAAQGQQGWQIGLEGGAVVSDSGGNSTRIRLRADSFDRPLTHSIRLDWYLNSETDDAYEASYAPRYWISEDTYGLIRASYLVDNSPGIDGSGLLVAGVGRQFVANDTTRVAAELGAGLRFTRFSMALADGETSDEDPIGYARFSAAHRLQEVLQLQLDTDVESGELSTRVQSEIGAAFLLPQGALKVSYRYVLLKPDNGEEISDGETFLSFNYGI